MIEGLGRHAGVIADRLALAICLELLLWELVIELTHTHCFVFYLLGRKLLGFYQFRVHIFQTNDCLIRRWAQRTKTVAISHKLLLVRINYALLSKVWQYRYWYQIRVIPHRVLCNWHRLLLLSVPLSTL